MTADIPWIQTFTGKRLDLDPPDPSQIDIEDIAHRFLSDNTVTRDCMQNGDNASKR